MGSDRGARERETPQEVTEQTGHDLEIGVIDPQTGGLTPFAAATNWAVERLGGALKDGIVTGALSQILCGKGRPGHVPPACPGRVPDVGSCLKRARPLLEEETC
jgi:hypothetical protein